MDRPRPPDDAGRRARGLAYEGAARAYLEQAGLTCLDSGWSCRGGELDLVMADGNVLVFVEVRARRHDNLVDAFSSVDWRKQRRLVRAARAWLAFHPPYQAWPARFDVVAMDSGAAPGATTPRWLRNAFDAH